MPKKVNKAVNNTLAHVTSIMTKYYRVGKRNRFKSKAELKAKSKEIWEIFKAASKDKNPDLNKYGKVTIKNLKHHLGRWQRGLPQAPPLPKDWDEPFRYWELKGWLATWSDKNTYPEGYILIAPKILGTDENDNIVKLKSGGVEEYTYEDTFKPFVDWINKNIHNWKLAGDYEWVKLDLIDKKDKDYYKKGELRLSLRPVDQENQDVVYAFIAPCKEYPKGADALDMAKKQIIYEEEKREESEKTKELDKKEVKDEKATSSKVEDAQIKAIKNESKLRILIAENDLITKNIMLFERLGKTKKVDEALDRLDEISKQIKLLSK